MYDDEDRESIAKGKRIKFLMEVLLKEGGLYKAMQSWANFCFYIDILRTTWGVGGLRLCKPLRQARSNMQCAYYSHVSLAFICDQEAIFAYTLTLPSGVILSARILLAFLTCIK